MRTKIKEPKIIIDGSTYRLQQSIENLSPYDCAKVINKFVKIETKNLEMCIDNDIRKNLGAYGIVCSLTDKDTIECALDTLRRRFGEEIVITDLYKYTTKDFHITNIGIAPNKMNVVIVDDRYLECAILVEIKGEKNGVE